MPRPRQTLLTLFAGTLLGTGVAAFIAANTTTETTTTVTPATAQISTVDDTGTAAQRPPDGASTRVEVPPLADG